MCFIIKKNESHHGKILENSKMLLDQLSNEKDKQACQKALMELGKYKESDSILFNLENPKPAARALVQLSKKPELLANSAYMQKVFNHEDPRVAAEALVKLSEKPELLEYEEYINLVLNHKDSLSAAKALVSLSGMLRELFKNLAYTYKRNVFNHKDPWSAARALVELGKKPEFSRDLGKYIQTVFNHAKPDSAARALVLISEKPELLSELNLSNDAILKHANPKAFLKVLQLIKEKKVDLSEYLLESLKQNVEIFYLYEILKKCSSDVPDLITLENIEKLNQMIINLNGNYEKLDKLYKEQAITSQQDLDDLIAT